MPTPPALEQEKYRRRISLNDNYLFEDIHSEIIHDNSIRAWHGTARDDVNYDVIV